MQWSSQPQLHDGVALAAGENATIVSLPPASSPTILIFLHAPGPGGVERIALRLAAGFRQEGMDARLLLGSAAGSMQRDLTPDARTRFVSSWPLIGRRLAGLRLTVATLHAIRTYRPDMLFCAGNAYTIVAVLLKLRLGRACPPILAKVSNDLRRPDMHLLARPFYRLWLRVQGKLIDHFAALSDPMADEVVAQMGVDRTRVHVVPNPVLAQPELDAIALLPAPPVQDRGMRFVAVGRLERQKDYALMLRAFAAGRGAEDSLTIFGEGREQASLQHLASRLGIAAHVRFAGFSPNVRAQLAQHDVLLLSSRYEGQPGVVVEALACGIAIIATRCCVSMGALLDDGALGTLVANGDEAAFTGAIRTARHLVQDKARAKQKADAFTIERAVPAYRALFQHILTTAPLHGWAGVAKPDPQFRMEAQPS